MRRAPSLLAALGLLLAAACSLPAPAPATAPDAPRTSAAPSGPLELATVVSVTDGDTIRVRIDGVEQRVRYIGIDAPEAGDAPEPLHADATAANAALVAGRPILLERDVSDVDRFGRLLRYAWLELDDGWLLVNAELVRQGLAESRAFPPDTGRQALLDAAEAEARAAGRGMWAD